MKKSREWQRFVLLTQRLIDAARHQPTQPADDRPEHQGIEADVRKVVRELQEVRDHPAERSRLSQIEDDVRHLREEIEEIRIHTQALHEKSRSTKHRHADKKDVEILKKKIDSIRRKLDSRK